jgi:hypothetical protein
MKILTAFFAFSIIILGCKKTDFVKLDLTCPITARKGDDSEVIGKWKLVKGETVFMSKSTEDYSCNEIIYHFRSDGSLIITANIDKFIGNTSGTYQYKFTDSQLYEGMSQTKTLQINLRSLACGISGGIMKLDDSPLDGPILYLVRL